MVAVGAGAAAAGAVGSSALGSIPLAFLWQPVTMTSAARVVAKARLLLILLCLALIEYLLPIGSISKNQLPAKRSRREESAYFQLQLGMSAPGPVSARFCVPSASMVMTFMWLALPSAELA